jgi:hypothetical protein
MHELITKLELADARSVPGITNNSAAVFSQILLDGALCFIWVSISNQILGGLVENSPRYRLRSGEDLRAGLCRSVGLSV